MWGKFLWSTFFEGRAKLIPYMYQYAKLLVGIHNHGIKCFKSYVSIHFKLIASVLLTRTRTRTRDIVIDSFCETVKMVWFSLIQIIILTCVHY